MDYTNRLAISYYKVIATINEAHKIYLVRHQDTGKIFVKKILDIYNLDIYKHLKMHPVTGIPKIIEYYEDYDSLVIIEEYVSGSSLYEVMQSCTITMEKIIAYTINLCDIVEKLHNQDVPIIHRDIKPSNIIVTSYDKIILLDFNAAKFFTDHQVTDTMLLGTHGYAAPEQYGFGSSSPQTDIYSIGILLKELSCSLQPPTNAFDTIINRCTQMNPADRYKTVSELKHSIQSLSARTDASTEQKSGKNFLPPGYRTGTPWKIWISSISYLLILWLSLSLEVQDTYVMNPWFERIFYLIIMLSTIFCSFNYQGIQRFIPLCQSEYRLVRYIGILLLDFAVIFSMFIILFIIENTLPHI